MKTLYIFIHTNSRIWNYREERKKNVDKAQKFIGKFRHLITIEEEIKQRQIDKFRKLGQLWENKWNGEIDYNDKNIGKFNHLRKFEEEYRKIQLFQKI